MAAGTVAKRWASAVAAPLLVLAVGTGLAVTGALANAPSTSTLAQGSCYQPQSNPATYTPPDYGNCGGGPFIKPQGWPQPKPKEGAK